MEPHRHEEIPVLFTDILIEALRRATFCLDLRWRSPDEGFTVQSGAAADRIIDGFRFDDAGPWLELEATANAPAHEIPQVRVRACIAAGALPPEALLRLANDANRRGLASVHCDLPAGTLVVQQAIVYTGYHDVGGPGADAGLAFAQREATLNMLVAFFSTCATCLELLQSGTAAAPPPLRRIQPCPTELLEPFTVFVLSRMVRWGLVDLARPGPAWDLVRQPLLRQAHDGDGVRVQERVERWLQHGAGVDRAEAAFFDALLFDVDRSCRWALRDVMADPPEARPLRQLMLLEQALAVHAGTWQSVQLRAGSLRAALARGLDLAPANVPETFVDRLLQRFPFLAPPR